MGLTERHLFENEDVPENYEWDLEDAVRNSRTNVQPVYLVMVSSECDDNYYPDYDYVYCVCSTKEKAEEIVDKLFTKYNGTDPYEFSDARIIKYGLDEIPEELNND